MTLDNRGWAAIIHTESEPTTARLVSEEESKYSLPLSPNDLTALCFAIATPGSFTKKPYLPDEDIEIIVNLLTNEEAVQIIWGKKKICTLNTVNFLTQAAPYLLHQYLHPNSWEER